MIMGQLDGWRCRYPPPCLPQPDAQIDILHIQEEAGIHAVDRRERGPSDYEAGTQDPIGGKDPTTPGVRQQMTLN